MNFFKTYKAQYEETLAELTSTKKQMQELSDKVTALENTNKELAGKVSEQLISKEDLDKLVTEHATFAKANLELTSTVESLKSEMKTSEEIGSRKAQEILASIGVKAPLAVKPDNGANGNAINDNPYIKVLYSK